MIANYTRSSCTCSSCGNGHDRTATTVLFTLPFYDDFPSFELIEEPYRPPAEHILREQADRERAMQRQARAQARRALSRVAGRRASEQCRALSVRALALKRAA